MEETSEEVERCWILSLPREILELVFPYLSVVDILHLERTCRQFSAHTYTLYWRKVTSLDLVPFLQRNIKQDIVCNAYRFDLAASSLLKRVGPVLKSLFLSKFGALEYGFRLGLEITLLENCSALSQLELNNRLLDLVWLEKLAMCTSGTLRRLSLSCVYIRGTGRSLDDGILSTLLQHWTELEELRVSNNPQLRLSCHSVLPSGLKYLDVQGCWINTRYLKDVMERCVHLERLYLTYVTDFVNLPVSSMKNLSELYIESTSCFYMNEHFAKDITDFGDQLRVLSLSPQLLTDQLFSLMATKLTSLQELFIPGCRPSPLVNSPLLALAQLGGGCRKLLRVGLRGNPWSVDMLRALLHFPALVHLDISYGVREKEFDEVFSEIGSKSIETIVLKGLVPPIRHLSATDIVGRLKQNCPKLKNIILL